MSEANSQVVRLWTCIARCQKCGEELNRAEHVPEAKKFHVEMTAPFNAICSVSGHSTYDDVNFCPELEWVEEPVESVK